MMRYVQSDPNLDKMTVEKLQTNVNQFISLISTPRGDSEEKIKDELSDVYQKISQIIFSAPVTHMELMIRCLMTIRCISVCSVTIYESDGKGQIPVQSSLASLLCRTLSDNYHSIRSGCKSFDTKTNQCRFKNPLIPGTSDHLFICSYHMHDSVSTHLVLACLYNMLWSIEQGYDEQTVMMGGMFGLYHDIGKPQTVETYEFRNSIITGFPGHGEIGAMMVQMHWSQEIEQYLSRDQYMIIVTAILRHMCGYHGDQGISNSYKRDLLLLEQPVVRRLLTINRIGDHFGKLNDKYKPEEKQITEPVNESQDPTDKPETPGHSETLDIPESIDHFFHEQQLFEEQMNTQISWDLQKILNTHTNKSGRITANKIVVFMIGTSGAGKSYFVNEFKKQIPDITVVSRDACIAEVCVGMHQRLENEDYVNMYKIYEAGKKIAKNTGKKSKNDKPMGPTDQQNQKNQNLIDAQLAWNTYAKTRGYHEINVHDEKDHPPNIPARVKTLFERYISDGLKDQNLFLVVDSFINCFPIAVESNVPNELKRYFRVHVHVQSYLERKDSTIAESVEHQLKVSGPYGIYDPIHPDGFRNGKNKKAFASLSAEIGTEGPLPKSTFSSRFRPHLVAGICTRTMNGDIGYTETLDCLKRLVSKN